MSQIDIKSPDEDENFDITSEDTGNLPMSAEDRSKPISDFITSKPEATEDVTRVDAEAAGATNPEVAESDGEVAAGPEFEVGAATETEVEGETELEADLSAESEPEAEPESEPTVEAEPESEEANAEVEAEAEATAPAPAAPIEVVETKPVAQPRKHYGRMIMEALLVVTVVGLALWSWNLYTDRQNLQEQLSTITKNPQALVEKQTQDLIGRVGLLVQLPQGETPTVAAVSDAAQAKQQSAFFANAQNGDKVLMYVKTGKAILYRPSTNKIILEAPLTFNSTASTAPAVKK